MKKLYRNLHKLTKLVQDYIKRYYNQKVSEGLDLKKGDKVYLLTKNFKSKRFSKKLNHIKIGLFKIINKVTEVIYRLDLLLKIKIHPVYYITMLEPVYKNYELLVYKQDIYKGYTENKQLVKKILQHDKIDS